MEEKDKTIEELNKISKGLNLLSRDRKVVLSHHKAFDLVDDLTETERGSGGFGSTGV